MPRSTRERAARPFPRAAAPIQRRAIRCARIPGCALAPALGTRGHFASFHVNSRHFTSIHVILRHFTSFLLLLAVGGVLARTRRAAAHAAGARSWVRLAFVSAVPARARVAPRGRSAAPCRRERRRRWPMGAGFGHSAPICAILRHFAASGRWWCARAHTARCCTRAAHAEITRSPVRLAFVSAVAARARVASRGRSAASCRRERRRRWPMGADFGHFAPICVILRHFGVILA